MNINLPTILDVAIGLVFIFFVFSLFVSGIVELVNSIFEQRAKLLRKAINKLLGNLLADDFFNHKLTSNKEDNFWGFHKPINYLSANSFSTVLVDLLANIPAPAEPAAPVPADPNAPKPAELKLTEQTFERIRQILQGTDPKYTQVRELIRPILTKSNNFHMFQDELETWYNGYMEQVSGWFKRYAQGVVWAVSVLVTILLNVDTIYLTNRLFNDDGLRERLVEAAIKTTEDSGKAFKKEALFVNYLVKNDLTSSLLDCDSVTNLCAVKSDLTGTDSLVLQAAYVDFVKSRIDAVKLPIGWKWSVTKPKLLGVLETPDLPPGQKGKFAFFGWLLTAAALSFGAPFWFDLLLKLVNIRNTARRPPGNPEPAK